ncbi:hypothetical protein BV22DRAFT_897252 [Leucogyrophana mollusca]|uniref:Uncharacterized protein n=1 Tax=Leucogyrophana mollusca TaxID=85980 RepID=A0ACB8AZF7_9AGAM|nr:hypothetical protein BV22DRAFT_897252 [Leucogyrophana mollusca]
MLSIRLILMLYTAGLLGIPLCGRADTIRDIAPQQPQSRGLKAQIWTSRPTENFMVGGARSTTVYAGSLKVDPSFSSTKILLGLGGEPNC